jgi:hypothetical protein
MYNSTSSKSLKPLLSVEETAHAARGNPLHPLPGVERLLVGEHVSDLVAGVTHAKLVQTLPKWLEPLRSGQVQRASDAPTRGSLSRIGSIEEAESGQTDRIVACGGEILLLLCYAIQSKRVNLGSASGAHRGSRSNS